MKAKLILMALTISTLFVACNSDETLVDLETDSLIKEELHGTAKLDLSPNDFDVNIEMVNGYLKFTKRIHDVSDIKPLTLDSDTLAWLVQYKEGWAVLSGDTRMAPIMASSEEGVLDLKAHTPTTQALNGLLLLMRDKHYGTDTIQDRLWDFLSTTESEQKLDSQPRRAGGEIATRGMWVAVDSAYVNSVTTIPHIIQTKWGQGIKGSTWNSYASQDPQNCPWNGYTMTKSGKHTLIGCAPVAVGQIIYKFRAENDHNFSVPMSGFISGDNVPPLFANNSVMAWNLMANNCNDANLKYTALFLSYLGNQMGQVYGLSGTSLPNYKTDSALVQFTNYGINYNVVNNYNFSIVNNSLNNESPICIFATEDNPQNLPELMLASHVFIIDSKRVVNDQFQVSYLWDNDYEVDYFEYNRLDSWRFEMPDEYDPIENNQVYCNQIISGTQSIQFAMNWGYDGTGDNNYWTASYRVFPSSNEYGYYPGAYFEYSPYWTAKGISYSSVYRMVYNFNEQ